MKKKKNIYIYIKNIFFYLVFFFFFAGSVFDTPALYCKKNHLYFML